jgi:hypothetical protein
MTEEELVGLTDEELIAMVDHEDLTEAEIEHIEARLLRKQEKPEHTPIKVAFKQRKGETWEQTTARYQLMPEFQSAITLFTEKNGRFLSEQMDLDALVYELNRQTALIKQKDLSRGEEMLAAQAYVLDALFHKLTLRAASNMDEYIGVAETYFKLALKAQSQCRNTWEALSKMQNPPLASYVRQLNTAHNQQINNENPPNQLPEKNHELLPDKSNEGAAVPIDPSMETVGEVHRSKDGRGKA